MDTIFALATAPGRAGVSVIRISGSEAGTICRDLSGVLPQDRRPTLRRLTVGDDTIDEALILFFPQGKSFTGEDVVEFHTHGSPAVVSRLLAVLSGFDRTRMAEAGEFTRRALENGRMSLSEVEGLSDLLQAETEAQRRQAFRTFDGVIARETERWRSDLLRAAALVEATIDFADEDVPEDVWPEVSDLLERLIREFRSESDGVAAAECVREGFEVAIIGPPNSGKSTLLNRLAGRDAAITSEIAGTTRDVIEVRMDVSGLPVTFLDTAGVRETEDHVEAIGVERALSRAKLADLRIVLGQAVIDLKLSKDDLVLTPKSDLLSFPVENGVSGLSGDGVVELLEHVRNVLEGRVAEIRSATHVRHRVALSQAADSLNYALGLLRLGEFQEEEVAETIRAALRCLDSLVGRIGVEDILGEIFSSFCIGK